MPVPLARFSRRRAALATVAAACLTIYLAPQSHDMRYKVVDPGTLGGTFAEAHAISDAGQIIGVATDTKTDLVRPVRLDPVRSAASSLAHWRCF